MRIFEHFNPATVCAICGTNKDGHTVLVPLDGTEHGGIEEAVQVHVSCLNLRIATREIDDDQMVLYQLFEDLREIMR